MLKAKPINVEKYFNDKAIYLENNMVEKGQNSDKYKNIKRLMDIILSIIGLIIGIPLVIIFGIAIKIETHGPIIFTQERVGMNGRHFKIYKLRSMYYDAEKNGARWACKNDPRITRIGMIMRKTRIDEVPQLINILKGDMSIVGPRPERPQFTIEFNKEIPGFINRLTVKPGLTGWAQVNGGYESTPEQKLKSDMYYIKNRSIVLDLIIILRTVGIVLTGYGAR
ncbi:exopolysaccharide biosynthesis polyprenyl glycosylphosphotransferase [Wukongibacter sp. M2B1]|uniref:exopolysaccharide biosynthesis polyprenyl glycosylphosphotransferase n=1 Tax=Wukongibacter sp. M2B1 TaxID=3088895 RepID=UPI003D7A9F59